MDVVPIRDVELTDKHQLHIRMVENVACRLAIDRWKQSDSCVTGHPDRKLSDHEVGTVLGDNTDLASRLEAERLEVRRHFTCFTNRLSPGVLLDLSTAYWLCQPEFIGVFTLILVDVIQHLLGAHKTSLKSFVSLTKPTLRQVRPNDLGRRPFPILA